MFDRIGPRRSLSFSTAAFAIVLVAAGTVLQILDSQIDVSPQICQKLSRVILFPLMVFINAFVQFLFTQHWSFLSSVMSEEEGSIWFAPIGGAGSIISTLTAGSVSPLVNRVGLPGLLLVSSVCLTACAFCSDAAYRIAEKVGRLNQVHGVVASFVFSSLSTASAARHCGLDRATRNQEQGSSRAVVDSKDKGTVCALACSWSPLLRGCDIPVPDVFSQSPFCHFIQGNDTRRQRASALHRKRKLPKPISIGFIPIDSCAHNHLRFTSVMPLSISVAVSCSSL